MLSQKPPRIFFISHVKRNLSRFPAPSSIYRDARLLFTSINAPAPQKVSYRYRKKKYCSSRAQRLFTIATMNISPAYITFIYTCLWSRLNERAADWPFLASSLRSFATSSFFHIFLFRRLYRITSSRWLSRFPDRACSFGSPRRRSSFPIVSRASFVCEILRGASTVWLYDLEPNGTNYVPAAR